MLSSHNPPDSVMSYILSELPHRVLGHEDGVVLRVIDWGARAYGQRGGGLDSCINDGSLCIQAGTAVHPTLYYTHTLDSSGMILHPLPLKLGQWGTATTAERYRITVHKIGCRGVDL